MSDPHNYTTYSQVGTRSQADIDEGLRAYMMSVYNYMAMGMVITAIASIGINMLATTTDPAQAVGQIPNGVFLTSFGAMLYTSPLKWVIMFAPLAIVFFFSFRIHKMSVGTAQSVFFLYATLVGVSISWILMIYTAASIVQTFFVTATAFGALSLYGYTTKKDLSGWGTFLFMGVVGLILASIVNVFLGSDSLQFAISCIGVLIFAGLTAFYTQEVKNDYNVNDDGTVMGRKAINGALSLYISFLNMFMFLLSFLGEE